MLQRECVRSLPIAVVVVAAAAAAVAVTQLHRCGPPFRNLNTSELVVFVSGEKYESLALRKLKSSKAKP